MSSMQSQAQYVLRTVEERGVRFVQLWFTDVLGRHKAFHVTPAELEDAFFPGPADILDAIHAHLLPLEGYVPARRSDSADLMRRSAEGI